MKSLKLAIVGHALVAAFVVFAIIAMVFVGHRFMSRAEYRERLTVELIAGAKSESQKIATSLLLPEEEKAIDLFLAETKKSQSLTGIGLRLYSQEDSVPSGCRRMTGESFVCGSLFSDQVRVLTELRAGDQRLGYLEKVKELSPAMGWTRGYRYLLAVAGGILLSLALLFFKVFRLVKHDVYDPLKTVLEIPQSSEAQEALLRGIRFLEIRQIAQSLIELQNRVSQQAASARAGEVAVQVAHDLRSPLSLLKILFSRADQLNAAELQLGRTAVNRLEKISEDLLVKKRLHQSKGAAQAIQISELLASVNRVTQGARSSAIHVQPFLSESDLQRKVEIDVVEFERSLTNLILNSLDAGAQWIRVQVLMDQRGLLQIHVLDSGRGIESDHLREIRSGTIRSGHESGHGLGLTGARALLDKAAGDFDIQSVAGAGTLVTLKLPTKT